MCLLVARTNICATRRRNELKIGVQRHFSKRPGEVLLKFAKFYCECKNPYTYLPGEVRVFHASCSTHEIYGLV